MFTVKQYDVHVGLFSVPQDLYDCVEYNKSTLMGMLNLYKDTITDKQMKFWDHYMHVTKYIENEMYDAGSPSADWELSEQCEKYRKDIDDLEKELEKGFTINPETGVISSSPPHLDKSTPIADTSTPTSDTSSPSYNPSIPSPATSTTEYPKTKSPTKSTPWYSPTSFIAQPSSSGKPSKPLWPLLIAAAGIGVVIYSKYGMKTA